MTLSVDVDKEICMSSGKCVAEEPALFRFDDEELAEVDPDGPDVSDERLIGIARDCPSGAISLRDGGEHADLD